MKAVSHLMVMLTTLILMLFGASGVGVEHCACSGRVSLVMPISKACCAGNAPCMTLQVAQLSAAEMPVVAVSLDAPQVAALPCLLWGVPVAVDRVGDMCGKSLAEGAPPGWARPSMVMRT